MALHFVALIHYVVLLVRHAAALVHYVMLLVHHVVVLVPRVVVFVLTNVILEPSVLRQKYLECSIRAAGWCENCTQPIHWPLFAMPADE